MILDIPNAFVQTYISLGGDKIIMNIRGQLVDIILEKFPGVYNKCIRYKGEQNILYVRMLKALYGMLVSSICYYKNFRKDIKAIGLGVNTYDICAANQMKYGDQQIVTWHVNDLKSSHVDLKVNDEFSELCEETYGSDNLGHVKFTRGKIHDYLGMIMDFTQEVTLNINVKHYIKVMLEELNYEIKAILKTA